MRLPGGGGWELFFSENCIIKNALQMVIFLFSDRITARQAHTDTVPSTLAGGEKGA
jgi:hypothetical protein